MGEGRRGPPAVWWCSGCRRRHRGPPPAPRRAAAGGAGPAPHLDAVPVRRGLHLFGHVGGAGAQAPGVSHVLARGGAARRGGPSRIAVCVWSACGLCALVQVALHGEELRTEFRVINTDDKPFDFTAALHTYIEVLHVGQAKVKGLKGERGCGGGAAQRGAQGVAAELWGARRQGQEAQGSSSSAATAGARAAPAAVRRAGGGAVPPASHASREQSPAPSAAARPTAPCPCGQRPDAACGPAGRRACTDSSPPWLACAALCPGLTYLDKSADPKNPANKVESRDLVTFGTALVDSVYLNAPEHVELVSGGVRGGGETAVGA